MLEPDTNKGIMSYSHCFLGGWSLGHDKIQLDCLGGREEDQRGPGGCNSSQPLMLCSKRLPLPSDKSFASRFEE